MCKPSSSHADYIVVGAGTHGMSFIDTLLTEDAKATVILVDRNSKAGGHWTTAYPHVRLHQPAAFYGVNSLKLGRNRDKYGNERYDMNDRSSGKEIAEYFSQVAEQFRRCGRVRLCFSCEYNSDEAGRHIITNNETGEVTVATCRKVVVTTTNVVVPSMRGPPFPVDESVKFVPCNDLPELLNSSLYKKYVVVGAGKTGMDTITHLLRSGVDQSSITWIVSRDAWIMLREGLQRDGENHFKDANRLLSPMLKCSSLKEVWKEYERDGIVQKIDQSRPDPTLFKGAILDNAELAGLRKVRDVVRMGRVSRIANGSIEMEKGTLTLQMPSETLIVDCMADMDKTVYGYAYEEGFTTFSSKDRINLGLQLTFFNPCLASAMIAYVEATFSDEMDKNNLLFSPKSFGQEDFKPELFFHLLYMQSKMLLGLRKAHKPAVVKIILGSRTFGEAPMHHGGLLPFAWGMFGPLQIARKGELFVKKVESGGFEEVKDCFQQWGGRKLPSKSDIVVKKGWGMKKSNYPPPMKKKTISQVEKRKKKSKWCCATAEVSSS